MKFSIILYFVLIAIREITSKCPERANHPVCASDKSVYANPCLAKQNGLKIVDWAECSCDFGCTLDYNPVCGSDGQIYPNRCGLLIAACNAKGNLHETAKERCCKCENCDRNEQCKEFCNKKSENDECSSNCDKDDKPVCHNGLIYQNQCLLDCEKSSKAGESDDLANQKPCDDDCNHVCYLIYLPVCGGYGKTYQIYANKCFLGIAACYDQRIHEVDMTYCAIDCPKN